MTSAGGVAEPLLPEVPAPLAAPELPLPPEPEAPLPPELELPLVELPLVALPDVPTEPLEPLSPPLLLEPLLEPPPPPPLPPVPLDPVSPGVAEEEHAPKTAKHAKTAAARIHFMNLSSWFKRPVET